ncbi:GH1 family beta-glucosidase [Brevibacillus dissolubilis]|uniref:GH1 family beta-glucosidase n=1 Tax=Brevibacillus dissolubilis TaxID=1844116 RepID=UPI0011168950|nr:GH1 family beta-glucosidase [Brevibacillus dissolubilis]
MKRFPKHFTWGSATASYQIEGAARADGKGESIWDRFSRMPGRVANGDTGDVACDHYHRYEEDIQLMKELNLASYRFSVSWPRIFPEGTGAVNQKGLDFYKRVIDTLMTNGITPAITLYHWDLPQAMQDRGGWMNRDMAEYYLEYANRMFTEFGDVVPSWITLNEPWVVSYLGYGSGEHAPGYTDMYAHFQAAHHLLLAHGKAVASFRELNRNPDSRIGITLNMNSTYPAKEGEAYERAARLWDGFLNRWFCDPVFKAAYPQDMIDAYERYQPVSFIKEGDLQQIAQPIDFLGLNYYSTAHMEPAESGEAGLTGANAFLGVRGVSTGRVVTDMGWEIQPEGLYDLLTRIKRDYGDVPLYITENGAAYPDHVDADGQVNDDERVDYLHQHLAACHQAIEDGVDLRGYYVWSLLDNFEWAFGYDKRFGIVHVDYETQKRTPKKSAYWFRDVIRNNGL